MCFSRAEHAADLTVEERRADFVDRAMRFGCVIVVCLGIWLLGGAGYFWPGWVLLIGGLSLGKAAREAYAGDAPEPLDAAEPARSAGSDTWSR